jgi:hypothetical protein
MTLKPFHYILGVTLAKRQGVDNQRANQLGLITGFMGMTPISLIATNEIAKPEAASAAADTSAQTASTPTVITEPQCCKDLEAECERLDKKINALDIDGKIGTAIDELDIDGKIGAAIETATNAFDAKVNSLDGRVTILEGYHSTQPGDTTGDPEKQKQKPKNR